MADLTPSQVIEKMLQQNNIWLASVRPDGRPHLIPVWFVWHQERIYLCIEPASVKARNVSGNPAVALALENGSNPVICEGNASAIPAPWSPAIVELFNSKYGWDISTETQYTSLIEVTPTKWLNW